MNLLTALIGDEEVYSQLCLRIDLNKKIRGVVELV